VITLSEPGVPAVSGSIPLCVPEIRGNEWKYIRECLDTNFVSSVGPFVDRFERELAVCVGVKYAVATVNGTSALHISLLAAGVQPDDEVIISTLTFIAPVNAIRYVGAWPVFIDAEEQYWQMDPQKVCDFIEKGCVWKNGELRNKATNRRVRAILPVHILGHPVDMDPILEQARKYNLPVIEDATECLGAKYDSQRSEIRGPALSGTSQRLAPPLAGSGGSNQKSAASIKPLKNNEEPRTKNQERNWLHAGQLGDISCFSFNGNKIITTGGGGMIVTDNEEWAHKAKYLTTQAKDDPKEFVHNEIGYNYRLPNIQAAMGCAQLEKLDEYIAIKRRVAETYVTSLCGVPGLTPMCEAKWAFSIFWMFTMLVDEKKYGMNSRALLRHLADQKIQARPLWQPMHLSPAHRDAYATDCAVAEKLNREAISLPCSVGLTKVQQDKIISQIVKS